MLYSGSRASKVVACSITRRQLFSFVDASASVVTLSTNFRRSVAEKIPIFKYSHSKNGFNVIKPENETIETRQAIDITAARKVYDRFDIDHLEIVRSENNLGDALSKLKHNFTLSKLSMLLKRAINTMPVAS